MLADRPEHDFFASRNDFNVGLGSDEEERFGSSTTADEFGNVANVLLENAANGGNSGENSSAEKDEQPGVTLDENSE